ncbi:MAG TPA: gliding motility-associated C-terminal domain-containing protein, partial [Bacteroidia bacterium]|nr:gliding motility-associated C-terminal domain-containing protein [Bacteroidia bacterium]
PAINITKGGLYTLYFTDPNGCNSYKDSANITLVEPPKLDLSKYGIDTIKCGETTGGIHGLIINSGTGPFTYNWYNVNDPSKTVSTDLILKGVPTGKYSLIVKDKNGCTDVLNNAFIPTNGGIIVRLSATPDAGVAPLNTLATATTSGNRPIDYVWWLDGVNKGTTNEKTNTFPFGPLAFGTHVIQVNVRDSSQCKSVDYLTITVLTSVKILDVNIFTPNNDGHNDILIFPMEGVQTLQGSIFDRWGLKLFEWSGAETGWDGNDLSGKPVPEGTYYYILKTTDVYGGSRVKSGYVELIRD